MDHKNSLHQNKQNVYVHSVADTAVVSSPPGHPVLHSDQDCDITVEGWRCHPDEPGCYHANHGTLNWQHILLVILQWPLICLKKEPEEGIGEKGYMSFSEKYSHWGFLVGDRLNFDRPGLVAAQTHKCKKTTFHLKTVEISWADATTGAVVFCTCFLLFMS